MDRNTLTIISIGLSSGMNYHIRNVFLYPQEKILAARGLQLKANKNLGGISSGIGFWGSPSWALGGAIGLGVLESIASNAAAQQGLKQLEEVERILNSADARGSFVPVSQIENIQLPFAEKWFSAVSEEKTVKAALWGTKTVTDTKRSIHNGWPFILVQTVDDESIYIALDKIETYLAIWEA